MLALLAGRSDGEEVTADNHRWDTDAETEALYVPTTREHRRL